MERLAQPTLALLLIILAIVLLDPAGTCLSGVPSQPGYRGWKVAVVFKRAGGRLEFAGVTIAPKSPISVNAAGSSATRGSARRVAFSYDREVWYAGNGSLLGIAFDTKSMRFTVIRDGAPISPVFRDDSTVATTCAEAAAIKSTELKHADAEVISEYFMPPQSLANLCSRSDLICIGVPVAVLRNAHTPINADSMDQHTVQLVTVEALLKEDHTHRAPVIKLRQEGGDLSYATPRGPTRGRGTKYLEDPILTLGKRYILFLQKLGKDRAPGATSIEGHVGGVHGTIAELDEYRVSDHWRGKVLIESGKTAAPEKTGRPRMDHWQFELGGTLIDLSEKDAIESIRKTVGTSVVEPKQ